MDDYSDKVTNSYSPKGSHKSSTIG